MAPLNWLELPNHLHALFMNKLWSITDYIHFGSVCRSWRFVFDHYMEFDKIPPSQLPLLLIPAASSSSASPPPLQNGDDDDKEGLDKTEEEEEEEKRSVYSISQRKVYDLGIKLSYNIHCRGSSYGWLVTVDEDDYSVRLFNPFLSVNNEIQLPPLKTFQLDDDPVGNATFLARTILSKDPILSSSNTKVHDDNEDHDLVVVVAIYGQHYRLAFCKLGDESWTTCLQYELLGGLADVTYYRGMLYMVKWRGEVVAFDLHAFITSSRTDDDQYYHPKPKVVIRTVVPSPLNIYGGDAKYIVESSGDLLQVQRFHDPDDDDARTILFRVFKLLNEEEEKYKWEEVKSLRDQSLFVGDNASMSLTASEFSGCMPNCIYFTDDSLETNYPYSTDLGVFNLIDGSIEQHYKIKTGTSICPPPIWVQPTLESYNDYEPWCAHIC